MGKAFARLLVFSLLSSEVGTHRLILLWMSFLSAYVSFWTFIDRVGRYVYFLTAVSFSSVIRSHNSARTHLMVELLCTIYPAAWASLIYLTVLPLRDIKAILP